MINIIRGFQGLKIFIFSVRMNVKRASGVLVVHQLVHVNMAEGTNYFSLITNGNGCVLSGAISPLAPVLVSQAGRGRPAGRGCARGRSCTAPSAP